MKQGYRSTEMEVLSFAKEDIVTVSGLEVQNGDSVYSLRSKLAKEWNEFQ